MTSQSLPARRVTGHVSLRMRKHGPVYYLKYRLVDGRQVQKLLGPAWTERSRPPAGYFTKRGAQEALEAVLADARRGTLPDSQRRSGHTFGHACAEWLRYVEHDRQRRPSTVSDYGHVVTGCLLPEFGADTPLERITTERLEEWRARLLADGRLSRRTVQKMMIAVHGVLKRAKRRGWVAGNAAENVERVAVKRSGDFNVLTPVEVAATARAAENAFHAAIVTVAAFTGLRLGELRALRWRDIDFAKQTVHVRSSFTLGQIGPPKSGKVRSVPLIDQAARPLDGLSQREHFTDPDDLVFCSETGGHFDEGAVRDAFYAALAAAGFGDRRTKPDPIVFHDLRHTFGTLAVEAWGLHDVQHYMGHSDIQTTMIYVHHVPKAAAADQLTRIVEAASGAAGTIEGVSPSVSRTAEFDCNSDELGSTQTPGLIGAA
jgi:integrase